MPGPLIQVGAVLLCPHGGTITILPAGAQASIDGAPIATIAATGVVTGCTLHGPPPTKPCTTVTWTTGATKVLIGGVPALIATSLAVFDSVPPAAGVPATVVQPQTHATAT